MFKIQPHSEIDKSFRIDNNELDFYLEVDYDDVNHERVDFIAGCLIGMLDEHEEELKELLSRFDAIQQKRWRDEEQHNAV